MLEDAERDRIKELVEGQGQVVVEGSANYATHATFSYLSTGGRYLVTVYSMPPAAEPAAEPVKPAESTKPAAEPAKPAPVKPITPAVVPPVTAKATEDKSAAAEDKAKATTAESATENASGTAGKTASSVVRSSRKN